MRETNMIQAIGLPDDEVRNMLWLRAVEWMNWPAFILQPIVPILSTLFPVWQVIINLYMLSLLWTLVRYNYVNLRLANLGVRFVTFLKWPSAIGSSIYLITQGKYIPSAIILLWPLLAGIIGVIPGQIGTIELLFAKHIGYVDDDATFP